MAILRILLEIAVPATLGYSLYASYKLKHYGRVTLDAVGLGLVIWVIVAFRMA